uniref:PABS domain-containing protein n=1 Tax=Heterorhabditis bacteriophora TaxID=37862 RepID=A0A1I7XM04_HETBA
MDSLLVSVVCRNIGIGDHHPLKSSESEGRVRFNGLMWNGQIIGNSAKHYKVERTFGLDLKLISGMNRTVLLRRILWQLSLIGFVVYVSKKYQIPGFTPPETKMNEYRSNQEQSERKKKEIETTILKRALSLDPEVSQQVLMIGLGGGQISNFFSAAKYLKIKSTVVEIDPEMVVLARDWFGHEDNNDTTIIIENGLIFIEKAVKKNSHLLIHYPLFCVYELEEEVADILVDGVVRQPLAKIM